MAFLINNISFEKGWYLLNFNWAYGLLTISLFSGCMATAPIGVPSSEFPVIQPVSASVPKACSSFIGGWAGEWPFGNFGQNRLWITAIDESCVATYTYNGRAGSAKINDGILSIPCGGGTCYFSGSTGIYLDGSYSQSSSQRARFSKIEAKK